MMTAIEPRRVRESLAAVRAKIKTACASSGRDPSGVSILAVTKGFGPNAIDAAIAAGLADIGENYYQEAAAKFPRAALKPGISRHFVGRVQRNKAGKIADLFDVVQTVDNLDIAEALNRSAAEAHKVLDVLVQVNAAGDQRQGVRPEKLSHFATALSGKRNLRFRGLMAMGPADATATAKAFTLAAKCFEQMRATLPGADILSMGMTDDLELAVAAGSTMLRLGTALFGPRPPKSKSDTWQEHE
jgi:pyridoxal phosphate enzyme (YggS family)